MRILRLIPLPLPRSSLGWCQAMTLRFPVMCAVGLLIASGGIAADDTKSDKKAKEDLVGEWRVTAIVNDNGGVTSRIDVLGDVLRIKFASEKVTVRWKNQNETKWKSEDKTITLDATQNPKQIDIVDAKKKSGMYGIYKVEGDVLTICYSSEAKDRPRKFKADGKKAHMELYMRVGTRPAATKVKK